LFLMLSIGIANVAVIYNYHSQQKYDAHIMNISGSQRMISQRISKLVLSVANGNDSDRKHLLTYMEQYDRNLYALWYGGKLDERVLPPAPKALESLFANNESLWLKFSDEAVIVSKEPVYNPVFTEAIANVIKTNEDLLKVSDDVITAYDTHSDSLKYSHEINLAGGQRMLSQKMSKHALAIASGSDNEQAKLRQAIELYEHSLKAMLDGGMSVPWQLPVKPPPPSVKVTLKAAELVWTEFKKNIVLIENTPRHNTVFQDAVSFIRDRSDDLLNINEQITAALDKLSAEKEHLLKKVLFGMLFADILLFIAGYIVALKIIRPLNDLSSTVMKISAGDLTVRANVAGNDEIGALATSFNEMTSILKISRDELISSQEYTNSIIASMTDALIVIDPDAKILSINKATCSLLGYEEGELIAQPVTAFIEGDSTFHKTMIKKLLTVGSIHDDEMRYRTKAGESIPVRFSSSAILDKDNQLVGIVGIAHDMRDLRKLMDKEKKYISLVAKAEMKKAEALNAAYTELMEKTKRLEQFQSVTVGREIEMIKLKEEINGLLEKAGLPKKYEIPRTLEDSQNERPSKDSMETI
nr:type IV pili methyl-accepting chemotaxis transducer N-terminal domain-containing protein [bacterium]